MIFTFFGKDFLGPSLAGRAIRSYVLLVRLRELRLASPRIPLLSLVRVCVWLYMLWFYFF